MSTASSAAVASRFSSRSNMPIDTAANIALERRNASIRSSTISGLVIIVIVNFAAMTWFVNGEPIDDAAVREEARAMRPRYMESVTNMDPIEAEMQLREWARENVVE